MIDETDYELKHLSQLVGWTVERIVKFAYTNDEPGGYQDDPTYGLILTRPGSKKQVCAQILCDPEGNGPGHLLITKEPHGT